MFCPTPFSGQPWHPTLSGPACPAFPRLPNARKASVTEQALPDASPVLLVLGHPSLLGAGEEGSRPPRKGLGQLSRGLPFGPGGLGLGNLQPWMQGLIAVAVFLVLVAIAFAVNHFWCQEEPEPVNTVMPVGNKADGILVGTDGKYSSMAASFRSSEHENAYENIPEEGRVRSTPM
nr:PDZK1-interacting protein 1 isoform X1 [Camelus dromedarius]